MRPFVVLWTAVLVLTTAGCTSDQQPVVPTPGPDSSMLGLPRAVHRATTLADGRVLFTGGCSTAGCGGFDQARASELFDPETQRFSPGPEMLSPRASGTATLLPDGRVLLAGGFPGEGRPPQDSAEVYDPATDTFTALEAMRQPRAEHTATVLPDGRVLLAGGRGDDGRPLTSTEILDAGRFVAGPELSTPRAAHAAVAVGAEILLVGGTSDGVRGLASTEVLRSGRWVAGPTMDTPRVKHAAVALPDRTVLVVGGSRDVEGTTRLASTELLGPTTGRTLPGPDLSEPQYKLDGAVAELPDHRIVIAGGSRVEVYDPVTGSITVTAEPAAPRRSFVTASVLADDVVLVAGGYDDRIAPTAAVRLVRIDP